MCRLLLYQGRVPLALSELLERPPHALVQQALAPKELHPNLPSADGWGAAWYPDGAGQPGAYRCALPMWRDANLHSLTPHLAARQFLAATRVATGNAELTITSVMPFVHESLAFAHNGQLLDFERAFLPALRPKLSEAAQHLPRSMTDSAYLFAWWVDLMRSASDLASGADELVARVSTLSAELGCGAILNFLLTNEREAVVVRHATAGQQHASLYWRESAQGCVVASEPLDSQPGWREVPKNRRLSFREGRLHDERALPA